MLNISMIGLSGTVDGADVGGPGSGGPCIQSHCCLLNVRVDGAPM